MNWEDKLFELLMYTVPAVVVFLASFNIMKKFFEQNQKDKMIDLKETTLKTVLPIRLQSFERIVLFLERIAPENLLIRKHKQGMSSAQLQRVLIETIQTEYEHNLAQQVYISSKSWEQVKNAKDETIRVINMAANKMKADATGLQLSQEVFQILSQIGQSPSKPAVEVLKKELRRYF